MSDPLNSEARLGDVSSVDGIIQALYEAISFEVGESPDWSRLRSLFDKRAQLVHGKADRAVVLSVEDFIAAYQKNLRTSDLRSRGFREVEIARRSQCFDSIAHVFSTYRSFHPTEQTRTLSRGINSIHLFANKGRWWAIAILWEDESGNTPIPVEYLPAADSEPQG